MIQMFKKRPIGFRKKIQCMSFDKYSTSGFFYTYCQIYILDDSIRSYNILHKLLML